MGFWNNLFKKKELPKPKSKKVGDKGYVRKPVTKPVVNKEPPKEEPPKQTFQEWEREKVEEYHVNNRTWGETWKEIASNELGGMTLVNGKNTHEVLEDPEAKHNLSLMLACCKAELERADIGESQPAPYYFKRAAILFNKQKEYDKEIKICELYVDAAINWYETMDTMRRSWSSNGHITDAQQRIQKALLKKDKAIKKGK